MEINHKKTYLQRCDKGVGFLGVKIEKTHINLSRSTTENFKKAINEVNIANRIQSLSSDDICKHRSRINSYLGILSHYNTFKLKLSIVGRHDSYILKNNI